MTSLGCALCLPCLCLHRAATAAELDTKDRTGGRRRRRRFGNAVGLLSVWWWCWCSWPTQHKRRREIEKRDFIKRGCRVGLACTRSLPNWNEVTMFWKAFYNQFLCSADSANGDDDDDYTHLGIRAMDMRAKSWQ